MARLPVSTWSLAGLLEVVVGQFHSATTFNNPLFGTSYAFGGAVNQVANQSNRMVSVRAHRDFLP
jgi:hypothetical protein